MPNLKFCIYICIVEHSINIKTDQLICLHEQWFPLSSKLQYANNLWGAFKQYFVERFVSSKVLCRQSGHSLLLDATVSRKCYLLERYIKSSQYHGNLMQPYSGKIWCILWLSTEDIWMFSFLFIFRFYSHFAMSNKVFWKVMKSWKMPWFP